MQRPGLPKSQEGARDRSQLKGGKREWSGRSYQFEHMAILAGGSPAVPVCMGAFLIFFILVAANAEDGFISIDCGVLEGGLMNEIGINYAPEKDYIDTDESSNVRSVSSGLGRRYDTLRSFPKGNRNCYKVRPVSIGVRYLVRASFYYGNYDGLNKTPVFDLHIGVNFWRTVDSHPPSEYLSFNEEIIAIAQADSLSVCLVNTGQGTPFISVLELRPLSDTMYLMANSSQSLVLTTRRSDYGSQGRIRYRDDPYDRLWFKSNSQGLVSRQNISVQVNEKRRDEFEVPSLVLRTAAESTSGPINIKIRVVDARVGERIYIVMHFAEMEGPSASNGTAVMDIYEGNDRNSGHLLYANYSPPYLEADAKVAGGLLGEDLTYNLSIYSSATSSRPPFISAMESYLVRPMNVSSTDLNDVETMEEIQKFYTLVNRNWTGDPCAPKEFRWHGVNCDYGADSTRPPRVVGLNLSASGLTGGIPSSLTNLTALTTLDLSNNRIQGTIPDFLAELPALKSLILTGNPLITGAIPTRLCEKEQSSLLSIRIEGKPGRCSQASKKPGMATGVIVGIAVLSILLVLLLFSSVHFLWRRRNRAKSNKNWGGIARKDIHDGLKRETHRFTASDIRDITGDFKEVIGEGGFGAVYKGLLRGTTTDQQQLVAVKVLSQHSGQGVREFQAEALVLTRVHHKNLVSLLGYCEDEQMLSLVYEYMDRGTLRDHLSGKNGSTGILSWGERISIALQAAQGLDYLHSGCKPAIVHRDVKSVNILLTGDFITKLADFGLSRAFNIDDKHSHITTAVAGTLGYLDPEYYQTNRLNERSDVYSFGVVLLELITGHPPSSQTFANENIVQYVSSRIECGDINSIVDPRLRGAFDLNSAWKMLEIGLSCTSLPSTRRPTMSNVVAQLKDCLEQEYAGGAIHSFNHTHDAWNSPSICINSSITLPSAR